jgi:hypothetical protein
LPLNANGPGDGAGDLLRMALSSTGVLESGDPDMPTVETPNEMNFDDVFSASFSAASNALDEPKTEPEPKPKINQTVVTKVVTQPVSQTVKLAVQKPDVPKPVSKMPKPDLKRSATPGKFDLK